jgi:hypothetical protein
LDALKRKTRLFHNVLGWIALTLLAVGLPFVVVMIVLRIDLQQSGWLTTGAIVGSVGAVEMVFFLLTIPKRRRILATLNNLDEEGARDLLVRDCKKHNGVLDVGRAWDPWGLWGTPQA